MEKFRRHGSVERVLCRGSVEDCGYPLLGIVHHINSYFVKMWRSFYTVEVWNGSYTLEAWTIVLICCWVSSIVMIPRTGDEKFLHRGSAERVQHCGSIYDCDNPLLGIEHHNDSYAVETWRSSYTVEVWNESYIVEA